MRILANGREIPVKTVYGRVETINDMPRDVLEVYTDALMQAEDVEALVADTQWDLVDDHGNAFTKHGYNHVLKYGVWLAQTDPSAAVILEKEMAISALTEEKNAAVQEKETLANVTIPTLLRGRNDDVIVSMLEYVPEWSPDTYVVGDVRKDTTGYPKICVQAHNSLINPTHGISVASLWAPYHAKSADYALPWVTPTGAHDVYKKDEYMVFTDGAAYKCLSDTNYSPTDYAQAWQKIL